MSNVNITINIQEEDARILEEIAHNMGVDREAIVLEALSQYVDDYLIEKTESDEAIKDFEAGKSLSHEEVTRLLADRLGRGQAA